MEIERKFLIRQLPDNLDSYPSVLIEQAYLSRRPVVRVRNAGGKYTLTCKGEGKMSREEINLPLTEETYASLRKKAEGTVIKKRRFCLPFGKYIIELDYFYRPNEGLYLAEVEFESEQEALSFAAPDWFGEDVTQDPRYHNANM